jgi:alpha-L-fucosidase 2
MKWKDGKLTEVKIKSTLGGNCRLRAGSKLTLQNGALKAAGGDNPNPFYYIQPTAKPIVSEKAKLNPPNIKPTFVYDFETRAGGVYTLRAM